MTPPPRRNFALVEPNLGPARPEREAIGGRGMTAYHEESFVCGGFDNVLAGAGPVCCDAVRLKSHVFAP